MLDGKLYQNVSSNESKRDQDKIIPELLKMEGRALPLSDGVNRLGQGGTSVVDYSLHLQEVIEVLLEPLVDESQRCSYEQALKDLILSDPKVSLGAKKYPNEYLSRILLDNFLELMKLSTLYFNLSLSSLITRFLVNLVYNLECWEIYHLLQALPQIEYFLKLIDFEIVTTPFGHIVKPPENYLGFNLRQGLQYTFPFPFYNYSYHSARPEARLEKLRKIHIEPYMDIRLQKSKKGRTLPRGRRFSSAVTQRALEGGFLFPSQNSKSNISKAHPESSFDPKTKIFKIMSVDEIEDDYLKLCADEYENVNDIIEEDAKDGYEHLEKFEDYFSDDEERKKSILTKKFRFIYSSYPRQKTPHTVEIHDRSGHSRRESKKGAKAKFLESSHDLYNVSSGKSGKSSKSVIVKIPTRQQLRTKRTASNVPTIPMIESDVVSAFPQSLYELSLKSDDQPLAPNKSEEKSPQSYKSGTNEPNVPSSHFNSYASTKPNAGVENAALDSPLAQTATSLETEAAKIQKPSKRVAKDAHRSPEVPVTGKSSSKSDKTKSSEPAVSSSTLVVRNEPVLAPDMANTVNSWNGMSHSRRPSQYSVATSYPTQGPSRHTESTDQGASTGQPVAQIVTLPSYGMPSYNHYSNWMASQVPPEDKGDHNPSSEQQNVMIQNYKYRYPEAYNPYIGAYHPTYAAPVYLRPEQIYYANNVRTVGYLPQPHQAMMSQQYPYMNTMYAPTYAQQQQQQQLQQKQHFQRQHSSTSEELSRIPENKKRKALMSKSSQPREKKGGGRTKGPI